MKGMKGKRLRERKTRKENPGSPIAPYPLRAEDSGAITYLNSRFLSG